MGMDMVAIIPTAAVVRAVGWLIVWSIDWLIDWLKRGYHIFIFPLVNPNSSDRLTQYDSCQKHWRYRVAFLFFSSAFYLWVSSQLLFQLASKMLSIGWLIDWLHHTLQFCSLGFFPDAGNTSMTQGGSKKEVVLGHNFRSIVKAFTGFINSGWRWAV